MKALTLWQPWAGAIALGWKRFETRSWSTSYRGPLLIHSARRPVDAAGREAVFLADVVRNPDWTAETFPLGMVVAVALLDHVWRTDGIRLDQGPAELALGDWSSGRFAWQLKEVRRLEEPIPAAGHQGLWTPDPDLDVRVRAQVPTWSGWGRP